MNNELISTDLIELDTNKIKAEVLAGELSLITTLEKLAKENVEDVSTKEGRDNLRTYANKFTKTKTTVDKIIKEYKKELKTPYDKVNKNGKAIIDKIGDIQKKVRQPLTDWENQENLRLEKLERDFEDFRNKYQSCHTDTSKIIQSKLIDLKSEDVLEKRWQEKHNAVLVLRENFNKELNENYKWAIGREEREAEMAKMQAKIKEQEIALQKEKAENNKENESKSKPVAITGVDLVERENESEIAESEADPEHIVLTDLIAFSILENTQTVDRCNALEVAKAIVQGKIKHIKLDTSV